MKNYFKFSEYQIESYDSIHSIIQCVATPVATATGIA